MSFLIEEIFDSVGKRLIENDYKALRDYREDAAFQLISQGAIGSITASKE